MNLVPYVRAGHELSVHALAVALLDGAERVIGLDLYAAKRPEPSYGPGRHSLRRVLLPQPQFFGDAVFRRVGRDKSGPVPKVPDFLERMEAGVISKRLWRGAAHLGTTLPLHWKGDPRRTNGPRLGHGGTPGPRQQAWTKEKPPCWTGEVWWVAWDSNPEPAD